MIVVEETRLALVLNGGVSLAVWMGGVTHELDLLRRASRSLQSGLRESVDPSGQACFELWQKVMREAHTRVIVDVIAGTSAGGLNGSLLAAAIGRGTALPNLRDTWQTAAALTDDRLLKKPPYNSLLDGQYFEDEVGRILGGMCGSEREAQPVTLFVTATALDGLPEYLQDSFGGRFQVADHRRIYKFQHAPDTVVFRKTGAECDKWETQDAGRRDFLDDTILDRLRLAARASAGFPVAFAPVDESPLLQQRVRPAPEIPSRGRDRASWIVDGGVLNNAPFGPVLDAIADRHVNGPVRRVVVYVVPSSGVTDPHGEDRPPCKATEWPSVLGTAITYPREADFRTGTAELQARMNRESFDRQLDLFRCQIEAEGRNACKARKGQSPGDQRTAQPDPGTGWWATRVKPRRQGETQLDARQLCGLAKSLFIQYRRSRIRSALWKVRQLREEGRGVRSLAHIRREDIDAVLRDGPSHLWMPDSHQALTSPNYEEWVWGGSVAERLAWTLVGDIERRLRDTATGENSPACAPNGEEADGLRNRQEALTKGLHDLSDCVRAIRAVQDTVFGLIRNVAEAGGDPARRLDPEQGPAALLNAVYKDLGLAKVLGKQVGDAIRAYDTALHAVHGDRRPVSPEQARKTLRCCLVAEVVARACASPEELTEHTPQFEFLRLGPDDHSPLFPQDTYAPLSDRKLYGIRLNHFGAFVKPEWRASDFTWGRLDASHHLLRLFIADHQERLHMETKLHQAILEAEIGEEQMRRNLKELAEPDDSRLFTRYLATKNGRNTFSRIVEGALGMLLSKGAQADSVWAQAGKTMSWRSFGRPVKLRPFKTSPRQWEPWLNQRLWPSRLLFFPVRWFWWRRIGKNPKQAMGTTMWSAIFALASVILIPFGIAKLLDSLTNDEWNWKILLLAGPACMVVLLGLEYTLTALDYRLIHARQRKVEQPTR
ncbi:patatin-like protein [Streptomyces sp. NPDC058086]|uniref:patatin-like protein n=1 Tax=Streptomyces sp. NPDC058086 TaxID=3346334 RepID=UPI0036EF5A8A